MNRESYEGMEKQALLNTFVNNVTMDEAIAYLFQRIQKREPAYVVEINVDVVMKIERDTYLRQISDRADLTLVDGQPLMWISKFYGHPLKMKISGSDLIPELLRQAEGRYLVFILGGLGDSAEKASKAIKRHFPNLEIAGTCSPSWGFDRKPNEVRAINEMIAEAHPDILLACFGCPKQEKWVYENHIRAGAMVTICAGATVDFLAGNVKRAPKWMSDNGFEWLYRFFREPKRLFRRYFIDDTKIFRLIWKYRSQKNHLILMGDEGKISRKISRTASRKVADDDGSRNRNEILNKNVDKTADKNQNEHQNENKKEGIQERKMRLGILCTMINGFGRRGYYNSQEVGLGRALVRMGHEVTIYKGIPTDEKGEIVQIEDGLKVIYLPMRHFGAHGWMQCKVMREDLDGLFCFGDQQIFLPHVYRWCKRHHTCFVPYIGTAHSLHSSLRSVVMNTIFALGTKQIYLNHPVLAKTGSAKEELHELGVRDVTVAPVGLDTAVLKQDFREYDRNQIRKEHGFEPDDVIICNVSRLSPEKRPLELVEIFMHIRDKKKFRLVIVGDGDLREELHEKIRANGLEDVVTVYDNVPYEKMWEIYVMSDYYLNLNKGEIFGMAIMEAVYYGTSVGAIRALGPSVTLKGMRAHKMCDSDKELEEWMCAPYPSAEELEESAKKMEENFTWNRCARAFLEIVKKDKNRENKKSRR